MCLGGRTEASQPRSIVQHPLYSPFRMIFPRQILDKLRSRKAFFRPLPLVLIFGLMLTFSPLLGANGEKHRSEEHTSELQSQSNLVCRLLLEKKKGLRASIVLANPVADEAQLNVDKHRRVLDPALADAGTRGIAGHALTPVLRD